MNYIVTSITCELQKCMFNQNNRQVVVFNCQCFFQIIDTFKLVTNGKPSPTKENPSK